MELDKDKVYSFLDDLRKSGVTNMFGAGQYIERQFSVNKKTASDWLGRWMEDFKA